MTDIFWFQTDLRLQDNPALLAHCGAEQLLLVFFWPQNRPWCNVTGMGEQWRRFLQESLLGLQRELATPARFCYRRRRLAPAGHRRLKR